MKKLILVGVLFSALGVAHAGDAWKVVDIRNELNQDYQNKEKSVGSVETSSIPRNYFDVSVGSTASRTSFGDTGTGYNVGVAYTSFQNEHVFLQPSFKYLTSGNEYGDKYMIGNLNLGYKYNVQNSFVKSISPKVGVGVFKAMYTEGSNYGVAYSVGVELGISERLSVEVGHNYLKGDESGNYVGLTNVSLKYKF